MDAEAARKLLMGFEGAEEPLHLPASAMTDLSPEDLPEEAIEELKRFKEGIKKDKKED